MMASLAANGQSGDSIVVIDLRKDWKHYDEKKLVPYSSQRQIDKKVIYLEVDPGRYPAKSRLVIKSAQPISVYLNYKLLNHHSTRAEWDIDSLYSKVPVPWLFGLHQPGGASWLKTEVITTGNTQLAAELTMREKNYYLDFSIIASLTLLIFFIVLLRTNPRLTFDYFNFIKLFAIQEREDALLNSRISSSVNMLYYAFSSFSIGFALLHIFHYGSDHIILGESFVIHSVGNAFWQWLKLSFFVFTALVIRLVILSVVGSLFDFREAISFQFYNSVRLGFLVSIIIFLSSLFFFVLKEQSPGPYSSVLHGILLLLVFWVLLIGLKLLRRSSFRFFHLFSYLCASELIPIVVLVKVLNS